MHQLQLKFHSLCFQGYDSCAPNDESCRYGCEIINKVPQPNVTTEELKETVNKLKAELRVEKTNLSATIRRKISVGDDRPSAIGIGVLGITVIVVVVTVIVAPDVLHLVHFIKTRQQLKKTYPEDTDIEEQVTPIAGNSDKDISSTVSSN